ncbi:MAG: hypothetical protein EBU90_25020 [Proteobacteria bacterium]|nr:hypothetical protein [Pseudomonadota bacterium]
MSEGKVICLIDNTEHKSQISLARYIKKLGILYKDYYDEYLAKDGDGICKNCGKPTKFSKCTYAKFCSVDCSGSFNGKINIKNTQTPECHKKISESWHSSHGPDWLIKRNNTILNRFGISEKEHAKIKWERRMSAMTDEELDDFKQKCILAQHGSSLKYKDYILFDEVVNVQGYEPYVLDILQKYFNKGEICVERSRYNMIKYVDITGKTRRYFPDVVLPNKILIEVKSPYTFRNNANTTLLKMAASYNNGYKPILVVIDTKDKCQMEMFEKELIEAISSEAWNYTGTFNDYPFIGVGYKQMIAEVLRDCKSSS